jgi:hypothetical protein
LNERLSSDFNKELTDTSFSALVELIRTLVHYRDSIILVGGWVPYLLLKKHKLPDDNFRHVGSIDIDLLVDGNKIGEDEYNTIVELINQSGWKQAEGKQFTFEKEIIGKDGNERGITVDFLTAQVHEGKEHRHRQIQFDLNARTMRGSDIGLKHNCYCKISGELPSGAITSIEFKMLDVVGCIGTKGIALGER